MTITIETLNKELAARKAEFQSGAEELQRVTKYADECETRQIARRGAIEQLEALIAQAGKPEPEPAAESSAI